MRSNRDLYLFVLVFGLAHVGITYWSMQVGTLRGVLTGLCCIVIWLCLAALFRHDARREREAQQAMPRQWSDVRARQPREEALNRERTAMLAKLPTLPKDWQAQPPAPDAYATTVRRAIRALARNRRRNRTTV